MASIADHPPVPLRNPSRDRAMVRAWLAVVALMIVAMVVVGGATRLTHSGLSITEWQPIHGVIPPLNDAEWQEEFAKYQQIPEYQQLNQGMTPRRVQGHLLVGMEPPPARPADRRGRPAAADLLLG